MPNQLKGPEFQEWQLLTIHDMGGKGTRHEIDDEIKKKLLLLKFPEREIDAKIRTGWYWSNLTEGKLIVKRGKEWRLTPKGTERVQELEPGKKRARERMEKNRKDQGKRQAVKELAHEAGIAESKVWLLKKFSDISAKHLGEILAKWSSESSAPSGTDVVECQPTPYQENMEVEAKAIDHILQTEPEMNWQTTPPGNPGFDLYRVGKNGDKIAWCEVKGISQAFNSVELTRREFQEAQLQGDKYWLYVVENVRSKDTRIIKIQDPAGQSKTFRFGRRWRNMAQDAAS